MLLKKHGIYVIEEPMKKLQFDTYYFLKIAKHSLRIYRKQLYSLGPLQYCLICTAMIIKYIFYDLI